jgi:rSAM/selenodomain-associated transferase 1
MRPAIILFARAPVPGRVKTRLAALVGDDAAALLHDAFVRDMLEKTDALSAAGDLELHTDNATDAWLEVRVTRRVQVEGGLELKMFHALRAALGEGRTSAMIVGTDAPSVPLEHLRDLLESSADVTFGPCEDGGYYAICCRKIHPDMFCGVRWSWPQTLVENEQAAARCGLTTARGRTWFDVDEPADLERLLASPNVPTHTAGAARILASVILKKPH